MAVSFVLARLLIVDRIAGDSGDDLVPVGRLFYFHSTKPCYTRARCWRLWRCVRSEPCGQLGPSHGYQQWDHLRVLLYEHNATPLLNLGGWPAVLLLGQAAILAGASGLQRFGRWRRSR